LQKLGILEDNPRVPLPSGNPNLIKEAKRRKTIGYEQAGSGLRCSVSIKFTCEWEQKFISGIDPTVVFQDILSKITAFATSRSSTYGMSGKAAGMFAKYLGPDGFQYLFNDILSAIRTAMTTVVKETNNLIKSLSSNVSKSLTEAETLRKSLSAIQNSLKSEAFTVLDRQIQKYRIEMLGIVRSLSGLPSTPWHVTIGNPLRPTFCSGDMYMESDLTLTLGPTLAFNDLPQSIKAEFTLVNARPWGLQEIMGKFNTGSIRVSKTKKDENDKNYGDVKNEMTGKVPTKEATKVTPSKAGIKNIVNESDKKTNGAEKLIDNTVDTNVILTRPTLVTTSTLTAAGTTKFTDNISVGSAINPIATETDAITNMIKKK
jgi:hypothetical protein